MVDAGAVTADRLRVVIDNSVSESALISLAGRNHWGIVRRIARSGDQPAEYIYGTRDRASFIHWIEDHKIGVNYILVTGPETPRIAQVLRAKLPHFGSGYIIRRARDHALGSEDRRVALYHLALDKMEHGFDQETFDIYARAMRDPDPFVRGSAVLGSAYLGWPQLAEPLRALASPDEPDASIRVDATILVWRLGNRAPLEGQAARDFSQAIKEREDAKDAIAVAEAKSRAAASGKEPFDYEKLKGMAATVFDMTTHMTEAERAAFFEQMYVVWHPEITTLAEFADHVNVLSRWM